MTKKINDVPYDIITHFIDWKTLVDESKQRKRMNSCQVKQDRPFFSKQTAD